MPLAVGGFSMSVEGWARRQWRRSMWALSLWAALGSFWLSGTASFSLAKATRSQVDVLLPRNQGDGPLQLSALAVVPDLEVSCTTVQMLVEEDALEAGIPYHSSVPST